MRIKGQSTTGQVFDDRSDTDSNVVIDAYDGDYTIMDETFNLLAKSMRKVVFGSGKLLLTLPRVKLAQLLLPLRMPTVQKATQLWKFREIATWSMN